MTKGIIYSHASLQIKYAVRRQVKYYALHIKIKGQFYDSLNQEQHLNFIHILNKVHFTFQGIVIERSKQVQYNEANLTGM